MSKMLIGHSYQRKTILASSTLRIETELKFKRLK